MGSELLLVVHPYETFDEGVTAPYIDSAFDDFDGDVVAVETPYPAMNDLHGSIHYDDKIEDINGQGTIRESGMDAIAEEYDAVTLGGGFSGFPDVKGCLQRCYDKVRDRFDEVDIATDLAFNSVNDTPYRWADILDESGYNPVEGTSVSREELAEMTLEYFDEDDTTFTSVTEEAPQELAQRFEKKPSYSAV